MEFFCYCFSTFTWVKFKYLLKNIWQIVLNFWQLKKMNLICILHSNFKYFSFILVSLIILPEIFCITFKLRIQIFNYYLMHIWKLAKIIYPWNYLRLIIFNKDEIFNNFRDGLGRSLVIISHDRDWGGHSNMFEKYIFESGCDCFFFV